MEENSEIIKKQYDELNKLHIEIFGIEVKEYNPILSHGSERNIIRLNSGESSVIGIINQITEENRAFISFAQHFRNCGLNVPLIYGKSENELCYITEDLGDETLFDRIIQTGQINNEIIEIYKNVIEELPKFQITAGKDIDYNLCYQYAEFGVENIEYDLNYFKQRFLNVYYRSNYIESALINELNRIKYKALEVPIKYFLYRDFQSRNIMIKDSDIYFIDFQSGRKGALLYDIASLLYDAKANIGQNIREELLEYYIELLNYYRVENLIRYKEYFWYFAVLRILQALGAYGYLGLVKGKQKFLESIPMALENIIDILDNRLKNENYSALKKIFNELINKFNK